MKEPKTLKDFEYNALAKDGMHILICKSILLKQEAIKWIKEIKAYEKEFEQHRANTYFEFDDKTINWIKHFFNICKEDLE